jgi:integrating conjugative element membrane protein (TIGR03745 family)
MDDFPLAIEGPVAYCGFTSPKSYGGSSYFVRHPGGNWLNLIQGYIKDGGIVLGLAISVIGFLWVSYTAVAKFNEARNGRAEWAEVGLLGVVAAGVLVFMGFLLQQAATII